MAEALQIVVLLTGLVATAAAALAWARHRLPASDTALVDAANALLPQTQCAQCGYPGCRPYAEAVVAGEALHLCPPGGTATRDALARLLNRPAQAAVAASPRQVAWIDESRCIGCALCLPACPVDAISGAPQRLHTVIAADCTGCELCLEPCPVDCIELRPLAATVAAPPRRSGPRWPELPSEACVRCGACVPQCPVALSPQELWWACSGGDARTASTEPLAAAARLGLARCIECGLCNQVCPSNIDLVGRFRDRRAELAEREQTAAAARSAEHRYQQHQARLLARERAADAERAARLARRGRRRWSS